MSNKSNRRRSGRRSDHERNLLPIFVAVSILVVAVAGLLAARSQSTANQPAVPVKVQGSPRLQVDQSLIDYGDVPVNEVVEASFKLSNTGDEVLTISHPPVPEVLEGC